MHGIKDLVGRKFGKLTVVRLAFVKPRAARTGCVSVNAATSESLTWDDSARRK